MNINGKKELGEPIEWRKDGYCGKNYMNSLKDIAKCNDPNTGEFERDMRRCCKNSHCTSNCE